MCLLSRDGDDSAKSFAFEGGFIRGGVGRHYLGWAGDIEEFYFRCSWGGTLLFFFLFCNFYYYLSNRGRSKEKHLKSDDD